MMFEENADVVFFRWVFITLLVLEKELNIFDVQRLCLPDFMFKRRWKKVYCT